MIKKILYTIIGLFFIFSTTGCWNYVGLDDMIIVAGVAVDKDINTGNYKLTYETLDLIKSSTTNPLNPKIIESEGKTVFDAIRNAKKRVPEKLYFGNASVIIISKEIASNDGVDSIINFFLRDDELRETLDIVVSQEKTAKDLLISNEKASEVVSYNIQKILDNDQKVTSSTLNVELYKAYTTIKSKGQSLVLPAFHITNNDNESIVEANGLAVFKKNKLVGFLSSNDAKYYLFATDNVDGGLIVTKYNSNKDNISIEITNSNTKLDFKYKKNKLVFIINIYIEAFLDEYENQKGDLTSKMVSDIEKKAEENIADKVKAVVKKVQSTYGSDIFGFGSKIYRKDLKLWKKLEKEWDEKFKDVEIEVHPKVQITNSSFIR